MGFGSRSSRGNPFPLRFLLAVQPEALTQVLAVVQRGISTFVIHHSGLTVSSGARYKWGRIL